MKKMVSLFLVLALCLSLTSITFAADKSFTDVSYTDWFYHDVDMAAQTGLIDGKTPNEFCPYDNMTIAEAIKLAACMHQKYYTGSVTLTNGSPNWFDSYIAYAEENGIPCAFEDYNAIIDRAAYVHLFFYALPMTEYTQLNRVMENQIPDVYSSAIFAAEIYTFYRAGILTGNDSKGTFSPHSSIQRCEVAAILTRMMDPSTRITTSPTYTPSPTDTPSTELAGTWHMVDYTVEGETFDAATVGSVATLTVHPNGTADYHKDDPDGFFLDFQNMIAVRQDYPLYDGCDNEDWCVVMDTGSDSCQLSATLVGDDLILMEMYPEFYVVCTFVRY